jgi:hypothetical protein
VSRPVGWRPINRSSFRFGGLDALEPMHETLLVTPRDIFEKVVRPDPAALLRDAPSLRWLIREAQLA